MAIKKMLYKASAWDETASPHCFFPGTWLQKLIVPAILVFLGYTFHKYLIKILDSGSVGAFHGGETFGLARLAKKMEDESLYEMKWVKNIHRGLSAMENQTAISNRIFQ